MNKEISRKVIDTAVKKAVTKPVDNLLLILLSIDSRTGKVVEIVNITEYLTKK